MCSGTLSQSPLPKKINLIKTERECTAQARCAWVSTCDGQSQMKNNWGDGISFADSLALTHCQPARWGKASADEGTRSTMTTKKGSDEMCRKTL